MLVRGLGPVFTWVGTQLIFNIVSLYIQYQ